ncbi:DUF4142 domain-containing protein [Neokomagataea anthophila]|uniref:DUF4142 domain-containing protein n=1 Tax=Neokomagataea anthophila TaxID=2826925 RepID=A0ABS5E5J2_9PROT|nr:DUF4142 domain-containing protein [Neokomagataea anthophila]MBR0559131.1 DUF4142 domain-containing protein [Neokomagataea anthophila]
MKAVTGLTALASVALMMGLSACGVDAPPPPPLPSSSPAVSPLSTQDVALLQQLDTLDQQQGALAALAVTHSNSDVVKAFAATVASDHATNRKAIAQIATSANLKTSAGLSAADQAHIAAVGRLYGTAYDRVFLREVVSATTPTLASALKTVAAGSGNGNVKTLASDSTALLQNHTNQARDLMGERTIRHHRLHVGSHQ